MKRGSIQTGKAWKVIRGMGVFTMSEVAVLAEEPERAVNYYIGQLRKCGYVRTCGKRQTPAGQMEKVFRLIKNTGPKPPRWAWCLYDPNLDKLVGGCKDHVD